VAETPASGSKQADAASAVEPKSGAGKQTASNQNAAVLKAIQAWTKAWSQKNMPAYFKAYDGTFVPPGGVSRKTWEQDRSDRILGKSNISLSLNNLKIQVDGDRATVTFVQHYKADKLEVTGRKTLRLVKRGEEWRITQENVG
jgi:ketosteroid isomerase-like protein